MFRLFIIIFITMFVMVSYLESPVKACDCMNDAEAQLGSDVYHTMCPFGDAVVVPKKDSDKENAIISVDCVNWDNKGQQWLTKDYDFDKRLWLTTKTYSDKEYEIYTMDGHLTHNAKGDVLVEHNFIN